MAVFRVNKTRDYTVMSNHHLRNTQLSLKAKGLLSLIKRGVFFQEWNTRPDGYGDTITESTVITEDITVYAVWSSKQSVKVTFDLNLDANPGAVWPWVNGGNANITVPTGDGILGINMPPNPNDTSGIKFTGWSNPQLASAQSGNFTATYYSATTPITTNITLYAVWASTSKTIYTAEFKVDFDIAGSKHWIAYDTLRTGPSEDYGKSTIPIPTRDGYTFDGWCTTDALSNPTETPALSKSTSYTFYAKWSPATYTITYNGNGGTGGTATKQSGEGGLFVKPDTMPTKPNSTFVEWNLAADGSGEPMYPGISTIGAHTTVYAIWQDIIEVQFNANGGSFAETGSDISSGIQTINVTKGIKPDGSRETNGRLDYLPFAPFIGDGTSYTFLGWSRLSNGTSANLVDLNGGFAASDTLYAVWSPVYDITFMPNNGAWGGITDAKTVQTSYGSVLYMPEDPTRTNYVFEGWYPNDDGSGDPFTISTEVSGPTTVYAHWVLQTGTPCMVTFNNNNGSAASTATVPAGGKVTRPANPTKEGYTFGGWYKEAGFISIWNFDSDTVTGNVTLHAKWTANTYTLSFNGNGATIDTPSGTITFDQSYGYHFSGTLPEPYRQGYAFAGWYLANGTTKIEHDTTVEMARNVTLYAHWTVNSYTVGVSTSFSNYEGGAYTGYQAGTTGGTATVTYPVGTSGASVSVPFGQQAELAAVAQTGYTFAGWYSGDTLISSNAAHTVTVEAGASYEARFRQKTYVVHLTATSGGKVDINDGTKGSSASIIVSHGTQLKLTATVEQGYGFKGWSDNDSNAIRQNYIVSGNVNLTARFNKAGSAILDPAGGFMTADNSTIVPFDDIRTKLDNALNTQLNAMLGQGVSEGDIISDLNGILSSIDSGDLEHFFSVPEKQGNKFLGWFEPDSGTRFKTQITALEDYLGGKRTVSNIPAAAAFILVAHWEVDNAYPYRVGEYGYKSINLAIAACEKPASPVLGEKVITVVSDRTITGANADSLNGDGTTYGPQLLKDGYTLTGEYTVTVSTGGSLQIGSKSTDNALDNKNKNWHSGATVEDAALAVNGGVLSIDGQRSSVATPIKLHPGNVVRFISDANTGNYFNVTLLGSDEKPVTELGGAWKSGDIVATNSSIDGDIAAKDGGVHLTSGDPGYDEGYEDFKLLYNLYGGRVKITNEGITQYTYWDDGSLNLRLMAEDSIVAVRLPFDDSRAADKLSYADPQFVFDYSLLDRNKFGAINDMAKFSDGTNDNIIYIAANTGENFTISGDDDGTSQSFTLISGTRIVDGDYGTVIYVVTAGVDPFILSGNITVARPATSSATSIWNLDNIMVTGVVKLDDGCYINVQNGKKWVNGEVIRLTVDDVANKVGDKAVDYSGYTNSSANIPGRFTLTNTGYYLKTSGTSLIIAQRLGGSAEIKKGGQKVTEACNGEQLTANTIGLTGDKDNLQYQWYADGAKVGSNSSTYTPSAGDVGKVITCVVSNGTGSVTTQGVTITPAQYTVTMTVNKNGASWSSHGKTFKLRQNVSDVATGTGADGTVTFSVGNGSYKIIDGSTDTGVTVVVSGTSATSVLNYYTVSFSVSNAGTASGSSISAVYNNAGISTGATVIGGKELVVTAAGAGATGSAFASVEATVTVGAYAAPGALDGSAAVSGNQPWGSELGVDATITSLSDDSELRYQWVVVNSSGVIVENISGANGSTYTSLSGDVGKYITCIVSSDTESGSIQAANRILVTKKPSPAANVTADDTANVITGIDGTMEYSLNGSTWVTYDPSNPPDLSGEKTVKVRVKETPAHEAGASTTLTFHGETLYEVGGTVTDDNPVPATLSSVKITVWQNGDKKDTVTTDSNGDYVLYLLPGYYNLVAEYTDSVTLKTTTVTEILNVNGPITGNNIVMPLLGRKNSEFESKPGVNVDAVGGLHDVYEAPVAANERDGITSDDIAVFIAGGEILIRLEASVLTAAQTSYELPIIKNVAQTDKKIVLAELDLSAYKTVLNASGTSLNDSAGDPLVDYKIRQLNDHVDIYVPLPTELRGKTGYSVYRYHDNGAAQSVNAITFWRSSADESGEYFKIAGNMLILHVNKFSAYAIAADPTVKFSGNGGSGTMADVDVSGGTYTAPSCGFTNPGYIFSGWMDGSGDSYAVGDTITVTGDMTLTAQWMPDSPTQPPVTGGGSNLIITPPTNGKVTANPSNPSKGNTVTVTVKPDSGYEPDTLTITDEKGNPVPYTDNGDGTYTFTMPVGKTTVTATFKKAPVIETGDEFDPDSDVSGLLNTTDHKWYVQGRGNGLFAPNADMTRAETAQMFYNLLRNKNVTVTKTFPDVPESAWYCTAVNTLASIGIISGYPDGGFHPDDKLTRAQLAAIVVRFAKVSTGETRFSDVPATHWAYDYINTAANFGWVTGVGGDKFDPDRNITRAETITLMNRMLRRYPDRVYIDQRDAGPNAASDGTGKLVSFTDVVNSDWFYYDVMEAANGHDYERNGKEEVWKQ